MANSKTQLHPPSQHKTLWAWLIATFFGAGYGQPGPGTYGSVAALLLWYAAAHVFDPSRTTLAIATTLAAILITLIGIPASTGITETIAIHAAHPATKPTRVPCEYWP